MTFGGARPKLHVVADFVEALGLSAFRVGDAVGMMAFDESERADLFMPARLSRGIGSVMGAALREVCDAGSAARAGSATGAGGTHAPRGVHATRGVRGAHGVAGAHGTHGARVSRAAPDDSLLSDGLEDAASRLAGQQGLVFLISDFHWPLERLDIVLDLLAHAGVVPVVVWDPAETEPPTRNALASLRDAESGTRRTLWLRPRLRQEWRQAVARRRAEIDSFFAAHSIRPFYVEGAFNADALSRYFFEADL
jgi:hypothetical protein